MIKLFKNKIFILSFLILAVFGFAKSAFAFTMTESAGADGKITISVTGLDSNNLYQNIDYYIKPDNGSNATAAYGTVYNSNTNGTSTYTFPLSFTLGNYLAVVTPHVEDSKQSKFSVTSDKDPKVCNLYKGDLKSQTTIPADATERYWVQEKNKTVWLGGFASLKDCQEILQAATVQISANNTIGVTNNNSENLNYYPLAPIPGIGQDNCTKNADGSENCINTGGTDGSNGFGIYFNAIVKVFMGIAAVLAMIMIIAGGIEYMTSGSASGSEEGKKRILGAIMGLLIALGSYALLNTINSQLLDVSLSGVPVATVIREKETSPWTGSAELTSPSGACKEGYVNVSTFGQPAKINVCKSMSDGLTKMLAAAKDSNIILSGWGSRSIEQQRTLRAQHGCPNDSSPPTACHPPTAQPGTSKHESGKAVDFNCNGAAIGNTSCFTWLKQNASTYGFKNLDSEPWHWSDNGY